MVDRSAIVDKYGELQRQVDNFQPVIREAKAIRKEIESWYSDADPAGEYQELGELYRVEIGKKALVHRPIISKIRRRLGLSTFLEWCEFPMKAMHHLFKKEELPELLTEERCGDRKIKAVPRAAIPSAGSLAGLQQDESRVT